MPLILFSASQQSLCHIKIGFLLHQKKKGLQKLYYLFLLQNQKNLAASFLCTCISPITSTLSAVILKNIDVHNTSMWWVGNHYFTAQEILWDKRIGVLTLQLVPSSPQTSCVSQRLVNHNQQYAKHWELCICLETHFHSVPISTTRQNKLTVLLWVLIFFFFLSRKLPGNYIS